MIGSQTGRHARIAGAEVSCRQNMVELTSWRVGWPGGRGRVGRKRRRQADPAQRADHLAAMTRIKISAEKHRCAVVDHRSHKPGQIPRLCQYILLTVARL